MVAADCGQTMAVGESFSIYFSFFLNLLHKNFSQRYSKVKMLLGQFRYIFFLIWSPLLHVKPHKGLCLSLIFFFSEFLLHKAKPDLSLVDVHNNTALHLACSKVTYLHKHVCMCYTITINVFHILTFFNIGIIINNNDLWFITQHNTEDGNSSLN